MYARTGGARSTTGAADEPAAGFQALGGRLEPAAIAAELREHVIKELFAVGMGLQGLVQLVGDPRVENRVLEYVDVLDDAIRTLRIAICGLQPEGPPDR
jgi:hypothetical protein